MVSGRRTRKAASTARPPGMYRAAEHRADDSAIGEVDRIFTDELGWMFTRNQMREYGIDGHALAVRGDCLITGRMLAMQVKGGASRFRRDSRRVRVDVLVGQRPFALLARLSRAGAGGPGPPG